MSKRTVYVVILRRDMMVKEAFKYTIGERTAAQVLARNLANRYGERSVEVFHIYEDGESVDVTELFINK